MTHWQPINNLEPQGTGTVLVWCQRTGYVTVLCATVARDNWDGVQFSNEGYNFTKFAYIDHPYPVPNDHPFFEIVFSKSVIPKDHLILRDIIGERGENFADFVKENNLRYYCGQSDARYSYICSNIWRVLFKTNEERLLAEIALGHLK